MHAGGRDLPLLQLEAPGATQQVTRERRVNAMLAALTAPVDAVSAWILASPHRFCAVPLEGQEHFTCTCSLSHFFSKTGNNQCISN